MKPLCIELFAGLHGWGEGFSAEGYRIVGFDIVNMPKELGIPQNDPNISLVLQDVLTLHGSQFKGAAVLVCSPPCQNYSYLAMPWSRSKGDGSQAAKALRSKWETEGPDNRLFDASFRIQREASEAAGRYIPMIVENVKGAQPWVGKAKHHYGSFYFWGDVPALMPKPQARGPVGTKMPTLDGGRRTDVGKGARFTSRDCGIEKDSATKQGGDWFDINNSSRSATRKAASARIAKIPFPLANYIAKVFKQ